jgi:hypothetical protein
VVISAVDCSILNAALLSVFVFVIEEKVPGKKTSVTSVLSVAIFPGKKNLSPIFF